MEKRTFSISLQRRENTVQQQPGIFLKGGGGMKRESGVDQSCSNILFRYFIILVKKNSLFGMLFAVAGFSIDF